MSADAPPQALTLRTHIAMLRSHPRPRAVVIVAGCLLGALLALEHWIGFVLIGIVVGVVSPSLRHAIALGVLLGGMASAMFVGYGIVHGQTGTLIVLWELTAVSAIVPPVLVTLGTLVRGLG